ncbi:MAG: hypothetical protein AAGI88_22285 [Pseudomonadota bacterium]
MVISHKYKYVFIELPYTATRAISDELRRNYDGVEILNKHSNYPEFAKFATETELDYFVFCGIRNPLQIPISLYLKYRNTETSALWLGDPGRSEAKNLVSRVYDLLAVQKVRMAKKDEVSFDDYFLQNYRVPFDNWSRVTLPHCDYVLRFEELQEGFASVLEKIGIQQVRDLPRRGNAVAWSHDPSEYYGTRSIVRAKWVFAPYMRRWGYSLPEQWGGFDATPLTDTVDGIMSIGRSFYWKHLRSLLDSDLRKAAKAWDHAP